MLRQQLLGSQYSQHGQLHLIEEGPLALALGAGFPFEGSAASKRLPNEDALLVCRDQDRALLAVADGHHGAAAHHLIVQLNQRCQTIPGRLSGISRMLLEPFSAPPESGTTLLLAVIEFASRRVFGFSFGDCLLLGLSPQGVAARNAMNQLYLHGGVPIPLEEAEPFDFEVPVGGGLLLCSDGVHECCYRDPHRSIQSWHILEALQASGSQARPWVEQVCQMALEGVDGHPGGQDNLAVIGWCP